MDDDKEIDALCLKVAVETMEEEKNSSEPKEDKKLRPSNFVETKKLFYDGITKAKGLGDGRVMQAMKWRNFIRSWRNTR